MTPPALVAKLSSGEFAILLRGSVTSLKNGTLLLLGLRDESVPPTLITLTAAPSVQAVEGGGKQTQLVFKDTPAVGLTAENARLSRFNQNAALWTVNGEAFTSSTVVQLAGLARQIRPNDYVVFAARGQKPQLVQVLSATDILGDASTAGSPTTVSAGGTNATIPIPVLHTQLTLATPLNSGITGLPLVARTPVTSPSGKFTKRRPPPSLSPFVTVLFDGVDAGTLVDQPPALWDGVSSNLQAVQPSQFASGGTKPILLQDSNEQEA